MKILYALFFLLIFVVALVFSFKNVHPVDIDLFIGKLHVPLALALTVELLVGAVLGVVVRLAYVLKLKSEIKALKRGLAGAEQEIEFLRGKLPSEES
jgi:uncharacterized integral membrane protein